MTLPDVSLDKVLYNPIATQPFKSVDFSASKLSGPASSEITFTNNSIGVIKSAFWDFGDGETSSEINPSHTYIAEGIYTVSLTVTGMDNTPNTETKTYYITISNSPPIADSGSDQTVDEGVTVTLDGANSSDTDGTIASYLWTQTGGTSVTLSDTTSSQPTFTAPSVVTSGEALTFELTVSDDGGLSNTDSVIVNVSNVNQAPTADGGSDQTVNEGTTVTLDGTNSSDLDGTIASYLWKQTAGTSVTLSDTTSSQPTFTAPSITTTGEALTFELTVTDDEGLKNTDSVIVNVSNVNQAPTADAGSDQTVNEGVTVTLDGTNSSDTDGSIASYLWKQTGGTSATLSDTTSSQPTFTAPSVVTSGEALTFELTITDDGGLQDTDSITITINAHSEETPKIKSINRKKGFFGNKIKISGNNFGEAQGKILLVRNGIETECDDIRSWSKSKIKIKVPWGVIPGKCKIYVEDENGSRSNGKTFYYKELKPKITKFFPKKVKASDTLTLTGKYFGTEQGENGSIISKGGSVSITSWSNSSIVLAVDEITKNKLRLRVHR